ncbi:MAG: hypothetical protein V1839_00165 [archaeon]
MEEKSTARKLGKIFGVLLFMTFLSLTLMSYSLAEFTSYNIIEPAFESMAQEKISLNETQLESQYDGMKQMCSSPGTTELPMTNNITIKCSDIAATTADKIPALMAKAVFDSVYYKKFDCSFITCLRTLPAQDKASLLLTEKANEFYGKAWIYFLVAAFASGALLFAAAETWQSKFKSLGFCLFITGTPYILLKFLLKKFMPAETAAQAAPMVDAMINALSMKFLIAMFAGVVLIAIGFMIDFYEKKSNE